MKRKVNLVGLNTLTVSLPTRWAQDNRVQKGDELECIESGNTLNYTVGTYRPNADYQLDISKFDKFLLTRYLSVLYRSGAQRITLTYTTNEIADSKHDTMLPLRQAINNLCDRLIGMEITSQSNTRTEITCLLVHGNEDPGMVLRRITYLLKETLEEFLGATEKNFKEFHSSVQVHHDTIVKYLNYYVRRCMEVSAGPGEREMTIVAVKGIDKLLDHLRHLADTIVMHEVSSRTRKLLHEVFTHVNTIMEHFERGTLGIEDVKERYALKKTIANTKWNPSETIVAQHANILLEQLEVLVEGQYARSLSSLVQQNSQT